MVHSLVSLCAREVVSDHSSSPTWLRWVPRELYGALLEAAFACCRPLAVGELVQRWPERTLRVGGRRKTGQTAPSRLCIQALLLAVVRGLADQSCMNRSVKHWRSALQVLDVCGLQGDEGGMGDPMGGWSLTVALCTMVIQAKAGAHRTQRKEGDRERKRFSALEREKEADWEVLVQVRADIFVNARSWERVRLALSTSGPLKLQCRYLRVEEISVPSIRTLLNLLPRKSLLGIDVRYSSLGVAGLAELLPLLSTFPELNSLRLHYCNLDIRRDNFGQEGVLRDLSQGLSNLQELRQLSLTALRLPGQLRVLLSSLPQSLEVLELPYLSLSPADLAYLSCSHHVSSLLQLDLSENCLDETTVPSIRRLLCQASSSLQHLSLSGCGLTDRLLGMLLPSLGGCWALKSLALALNPLSRAGLCDLMRTAARMPCLRLLLYPNALEDYQPGLPELPSSTQLLEWPLDESVDSNTTSNKLSQVMMDSGRSDLVLTCDLLNFDKDMVD
uniref:Leucine-rich repeat-containing protein 14B n=1 Tax=Poecilia formosa TaxID=48698 RepID=A0A096LV49_POEFO